MKVVLFTHPPFLRSQSMPRFAAMLTEGMRQRGHDVTVWTPEPFFFRTSAPAVLRKWLGYADQYLLFPLTVRRRLKGCAADTLFVFVDHALGPWIPLVAQRPHVIHCHDFLAQRSAQNEIVENRTGWSGRRYQAFIRRGYAKGKSFLSVSQRTKKDLQRFLSQPPAFSEVVYNGVNKIFTPLSASEARTGFSEATGLPLSAGYLLHVGGNQWYKNRSGVIEIYEAWRSLGGAPLPLVLVGEPPSALLDEQHTQSFFNDDIHFVSGLSDEVTRLAYAGANAFLFPSLAEGFGWPIAEAMACGCPVLTTAESPMTEVAGEAAFLIPRRPSEKQQAKSWAKDAAVVLQSLLTLSAPGKKALVEKGFRNAARFDADAALDQIESVYRQIVSKN